jgi:hypothetical protein
MIHTSDDQILIEWNGAILSYSAAEWVAFRVAALEHMSCAYRVAELQRRSADEPSLTVPAGHNSAATGP